MYAMSWSRWQLNLNSECIKTGGVALVQQAPPTLVQAHGAMSHNSVMSLLSSRFASAGVRQESALYKVHM